MTIVIKKIKNKNPVETIEICVVYRGIVNDEIHIVHVIHQLSTFFQIQQNRKENPRKKMAQESIVSDRSCVAVFVCVLFFFFLPFSTNYL